MSPAGRGRSSGGSNGKSTPTGARRGAGRTAPGGQGAAPRTGSGRGSGGPKHLKPQPRAAEPSSGGRGGARAGGRSGPARGTGPSSGGGPARTGGAGRGSGGGGGRRGTASGQRGTTPVRRDADASRRALGGEQVEGRHAVFELLLAGARRTREVLLAGDLDPAPILDDIIDLADELKVPVREI